ncbi:MAG: TspO/MBR family protein [Burkholderiaceae bacterium]
MNTKPKSGISLKPVAAAAVAAIIVASLGAWVTNLGPWYYSLQKPSWEPPDWLFGPVWTLIFALITAAGLAGWTHARRRGRGLRIVLAFAVNLALNLLWSWLFFREERPDWALTEVGFLWVSILCLMVLLWPDSRVGTFLLVPYALWVGFAAVLNGAVVNLNGPFGR